MKTYLFISGKNKNPKNFKRKNKQKTCRSLTEIRMVLDFSTVTLEGISQWNVFLLKDISFLLKENYFQIKNQTHKRNINQGKGRTEILAVQKSLNLPPMNHFLGSYWRIWTIKRRMFKKKKSRNITWDLENRTLNRRKK